MSSRAVKEHIDWMADDGATSIILMVLLNKVWFHLMLDRSEYNQFSDKVVDKNFLRQFYLHQRLRIFYIIR